MLTYLLDVSICLACFYALYISLLSRETFFQMNRWYLLGTLGLSLALPVLPPMFTTAAAEPLTSLTIEPIIVGVQDVGQALAISPSQPVWLSVLLAIYWTGVAVMGTRFVLNLLALRRLAQRGDKYRQDISGVQVIYTDTQVPFSFFNTIFLPRNHRYSEQEITEILRHETAHVMAWHSIDVIAIELIGIVLWPSPFIYLYRKSIRRIHEYLADTEVLKQSSLKEYGQLLLSQSAPGMQLALANHFFHNQLKQRIMMMTKHKSGRSAFLKYTAFAPMALVVIALFAFRPGDSAITQERALSEAAQDTVPSGVFRVVDEMPRFPGCENSGLSGDALQNCAMQKMIEHVYKTMKYPKEAKEAGVSGRAVAKFVVHADGRIGDIEILRSIGYGTDDAVRQVLASMPAWRPGYQDHQAVDVEMVLPISFTLDHDAEQNGAEEPGVATGEQMNQSVYAVVDQMPRFPGCEQDGLKDVALMECANHKLIDYIGSHLKYPEAAKKAGAEGKSVVRFVVQKDGSIADAKILRSVGYGTDEVVLALVEQMPDWIPGWHQGEAVNVAMTLPIVFALPKPHQKDEADNSPMEIAVFPNPSNSQLAYQINNLPEGTDALVIELFNQNGQSVHQEVRQPDRSQRTFSGTLEPGKLTAGTYVLRILVNNTIVTQQVVIQ